MGEYCRRTASGQTRHRYCRLVGALFRQDRRESASSSRREDMYAFVELRV
jgi:hypothetical protein